MAARSRSNFFSFSFFLFQIFISPSFWLGNVFLLFFFAPYIGLDWDWVCVCFFLPSFTSFLVMKDVFFCRGPSPSWIELDRIDVVLINVNSDAMILQLGFTEFFFSFFFLNIYFFLDLAGKRISFVFLLSPSLRGPSPSWIELDRIGYGHDVLKILTLMSNDSSTGFYRVFFFWLLFSFQFRSPFGIELKWIGF